MIRTEEKGSDVNLAVHLLNDGWLDAYDCAIVVSNDSDIAEAMRLVRQHHGERIGLVTPGTGRPSRQLMAHVDFSRHIRPDAPAALATAGSDTWHEYQETVSLVA